MYERRFNDNMSRHRLNVKLAPSKPKPACRIIQINDIPREQKTLAHYHVANQVKNEVPVIGQSSPIPTYQDSYFERQPSSTESQSSLFQAQNNVPAIIGIKRSNSQESGFCTGGDSDVASNFSVVA